MMRIARNIMLVGLLGVSLVACKKQDDIDYAGGGADGSGGAYNSGGAYGQYGSDGSGASGQYGANGAAGAGGPSSVSYLSENISNTVWFSIDHSDLTDEARAVLAQQAQWIKQNQSRILIEGHADEQGTREYNIALGARRAATVRDYLVSLGVEQSRLSVVSYGKERPLSTCSDEACWSKNRRAVTVVQ